VERVTVLAQVAVEGGLSGIDTETAENAAREIIADEQKMADLIAQNWDRFAELLLEEAGVGA
jgi:hypothetical protein